MQSPRPIGCPSFLSFLCSPLVVRKFSYPRDVEAARIILDQVGLFASPIFRIDSSDFLAESTGRERVSRIEIGEDRILTILSQVV